MENLMNAFRTFLLGLSIALLDPVAHAQTALPALCPEIREQSPFLVLASNGFVYSKDLLEMEFTAQPFVRDLADVRLRLSRMGVELVPVPVPWGSMVTFPLAQAGANEFFNYDPTTARQQFTGIVNSFRQAGLSTPNLLTTFLAHSNEELFFTADHHWKLPAVKLAAQAVKTAVRTSTRTSLREDGITVPSPVFQGIYSFKGGFGAAIEARCNTPWPLETTFQGVVQDVAGTDLLGDQVAPVVLFGSSFSRSPSSNVGIQTYIGYGFQQLLAWELQANVQNESFSSGSQTSMLLFFSEPQNMSGRKLALWEFPIYDFSRARLEHNAAFFAQLIPLLSRAAHPDAPPLMVLKDGQVDKETLTFTLPSQTLNEAVYFRLLLPEPTPLTPQVTFTTKTGSVTIDLKRDGNKLVQKNEFVLRPPVPISEITSVSWFFTTPPKATKVQLQGATLNIFRLQ